MHKSANLLSSASLCIKLKLKNTVDNSMFFALIKRLNKFSVTSFPHFIINISSYSNKISVETHSV